MGQGFFQIGVTLCILIAITPLLGRYIARVFMGDRTLLDPVLNPVEQTIYLLAGMPKQDSMTGWQYARAALYSNIIMGIIVCVLLSLQKFLPWNPTGLAAPRWDIVLHTTISFLTNTDQQHYSGETTLSDFSQTAALAFLMFTSAATGLAVGIAFIRGLTGRPLGNFYIDLTRGITRILLPISIVGAIALLILGVPQTFDGPLIVTTLEEETQYIARGPVASFEIIKQLGENGGGFFGMNSAHPFENPNSVSNLIETIAMICIPGAMIYTYGLFAKNTKQAWQLFWMVFIIYIILISVTAIGENQGNPIVNEAIGLRQQPNLEGKELRFGWAQTALWAVTTTGTMCGAVNGMHDSLMPQGIFSTMLNLFLQIVWGGQGTGTAYLFIYLILTVFLTGLMVGRTPELFGRKIEKREIVLSSVVLLIHPIAVLIPSALALTFPAMAFQVPPPGYTGSPEFHNISRVVYEYASASANNGSGLEGLGDSTLWWNLSTTFSMLMGRYIPIIAILLLADSMRSKHTVPETPGTLKTDTTLFTTVTAGVILILGVLTFFPVLALGPIAEAFNLRG